MTSVRNAVALAIVLASTSKLAGEATPERPLPAPTAVLCPPGNLLAGRKPWAWSDVRGEMGLATDGIVAPEGAAWDGPLAVVLDTPASTLAWDLGAVTTVSAAYVQADANDAYTVWGSLDGQLWKEIGRIEPVRIVHGLRGRTLSLGGAAVRFVRFGEGQGDSFYSLSEMQVFCQVPTPFPPSLAVGDTTKAAATTLSDYWNDETSARWALVLALVALCLLQWGAKLRREGKPNFRKKVRDRALAVLGVLAALTYVNFGFFHFGNFIHEWEWTHYYVGAKYFRELSYDGLYECIAVADVEDGLRRRVELRKLTNLRTNQLEPTAEILQHPERCKQRFSVERWEAFRRDVRFFRRRQTARRWDELQSDHGYNGTPVWNVAGSVLANLAPASEGQLYTLALLDPLYLVATWGVIGWAFGWRVLAVSLLVFATNFPSRFFWTGGSFLRWDWLFYTVAAICCLKKRRPVLAGMSLGYATLLRVFPVFVFVGPLFAMAWQLYDQQRIGARYARFVAGVAIATALLVPLSLGVSGGIGGHRQFIENSIKHTETPLTNYMGLRTVVAWRPSEVGRYLRSDALVDPWSRWKEARLRAFQEARAVYAIVVASFLVLLGLVVRSVEPWEAVALGLSFIAVGAELTCYYYAFIIGMALLWEKRDEIGRWLLALTAFTQFVAWAPIRHMSTWRDEQYTLMSAATLVVFGAILWIFRKPGASQVELADSKGRPRSGKKRR